MSIKKSICKLVGESILPKELYQYKKDIKEELEQLYKDEILHLKDALKRKQKEIDELIAINKDVNKEAIEENKVLNNEINKDKDKTKSKSKDEIKTDKKFNFPRNMLE